MIAPQEPATLVAVALAAKVLMRTFGTQVAHLPHPWNPLLRAGALVCFFVCGLSAPAVLVWTAVICRVGYLIDQYLIASPNHPFLECMLLVPCGVLLQSGTPGDGALLGAYLQAAVLSVWLHAAIQKMGSRQFTNGLFFYAYMAERPRHHWTQKWCMPRRWCAAHSPLPTGVLEAGPLRAARMLAAGVILLELVVPPLAALYGGPTAAAVMALLALGLGLFAREWSFMGTNLILAALFLVPLDVGGFRAIGHHPLLVAGALAAAGWPLVHGRLYRRFDFAPSRLFGWGMYCGLEPLVTAYAGDGRPLPRDPASPRARQCRALITGFGMVRLPWLRRLVYAVYQKWAAGAPVVAFQFTTFRREGRRLLSEVCLIPTRPDGPTLQAVFSGADGARAWEVRRTRALTGNANRLKSA